MTCWNYGPLQPPRGRMNGRITVPCLVIPMVCNRCTCTMHFMKLFTELCEIMSKFQGETCFWFLFIWKVTWDLIYCISPALSKLTYWDHFVQHFSVCFSISYLSVYLCVCLWTKVFSVLKLYKNVQSFTFMYTEACWWHIWNIIYLTAAKKATTATIGLSIWTIRHLFRTVIFF